MRHKGKAWLVILICCTLLNIGLDVLFVAVFHWDVAGVAGGLAVDILFGVYIGLTPLMYLVVGVLAGIFYKRYYANNILLPAFVVGAGVIIKESLTGLFLMLVGSEFNFALMLVRYVLPAALMTAGISIPLFLLFRYLFARQTKRGARYE